MDYCKLIKGDITKADFNDFRQTRENPFPAVRLLDFMTLGPFVAQTDGAFETEYLYEREKVLEIDYLLPDGGEAAAVPYITAPVKNDYYGDEYLLWKRGRRKWGALRFEEVDSACVEEVYLTEQRNCVFYAATYVDCAENVDAVISYENSGCRLFLNGVLVDDEPYGRVKGISDTGKQVAVSFKRGRNLLLFKLRTGYICDTFDLSMTNCMIYPAACRAGALGITRAEPTAAYLGTPENPLEVFPAFAAAFEDSDGGEVKYSADGFEGCFSVPPLKRGECALVRFSVPAGINESKTLEVSSRLSEKGGEGADYSFFVKTEPYSGFDFVELQTSDFHFDTTYHQEQRTYAMGAIHITKTMLEELERDPNFKVTLSEVDYLHPYYAVYPRHRETLRKAFLEGRAEADCFYNQPNDLTSSGEGFIRNLVYGQLYHRDVMGRTTYVYSPNDVFGHFNQLSQICAKGGVGAARWGKTIWGLDGAFWHISPDGTELLHDQHISKDFARRKGLRHCGECSSRAQGMPAFPQQGDTSWKKDTLSHAHMSVFSELDLNAVKESKEQCERDGYSKIEHTARDLTRHHSGVLLTRTDFKQANRIAENLLITAEKLSVFAGLYGADYPEKALDKAWRQLLCAQHHDSVTGTNNEISFVDLMIEYRESAELAAEIVLRAMSFLASGVKLEKGETPFFVFNPHEWERCDKCAVTIPAKAAQGYALFDENGKEYPLTVTSVSENGAEAWFIPRVPALGYSVYTLKKAAKAPQTVFGGDTVIENAFWRLKVDKKLGGGIVSIYDKKNKRETVATGEDGPANRVVVLREVPDRCETQHEIYTTGHKLFSTEFPAEVKSEKCPLYQRLTIYIKMDVVARVKQEITLWRGVERIDMKTVVEDYLGRDDLFMLTFPAALNGAKTVFDDRCAPHVCTKSKNKLTFQTHQYFNYSHSHIAPTNQWLDLGPTVTARLPGGSVNLGMAALIRPEKKEFILAGECLLRALAKKAIPVTPFPDRGEQHSHHQVIHFNEDILDTDTRFVLCVEGEENEYEQKLFAGMKKSAASAFEKSLKKSGKAVAYTVDSDNLHGKPIDVFVLKAVDFSALNELIGKLSDELSSGRFLDLTAAACGVQPTESDDYGVALINNGTISCSVEGENMLGMMLFHTADFYGNQGRVTGGKQLIPEQKTHCFTYALLPHTGSYREAELFKRAFEFNDPLLACEVTERSEGAFLPRSKSLIKGGGNFVLTCVKAGDYPLARMSGKVGNVFERGIVLRGFETDGVDGKARLKFGFDVSGGEAVNLLEEEAKPLSHFKNGAVLDTKCHSIDTFRFAAEDSGERIAQGVAIGAVKELAEPTYIRSWEHNMGSMPMGYLGVVGVIGRNVKKLDERTSEFEISVVNNRTDTPASGEMRLLLPEGFTAERVSFPYALEAGGYELFTVTVTKPQADSKGALRLEYFDDGQSFEDVFNFGSDAPTLTLEIADGGLVAHVANYTGDTLRGELSLASPFETWKLDGFNHCAFGETAPRSMPVSIENGERKEFEFKVDFNNSDMLLSFWAAVKLAVGGHVYYAFAEKRSERHNFWTHVFTAEIESDNCSLRRLLEMN